MINIIVFNEIVQDNREYIITDISLYFRHSGRIFAAEDTICNKVETGDKSDDPNRFVGCAHASWGSIRNNQSIGMKFTREM